MEDIKKKKLHQCCQEIGKIIQKYGSDKDLDQSEVFSEIIHLMLFWTYMTLEGKKADEFLRDCIISAKDMKRRMDKDDGKA